MVETTQERPQEEEIVGVLEMNHEAKTATVNGLKLWVAKGLWDNISQHYYTNDYVKAAYTTDGERRQLKSLVMQL